MSSILEYHHISETVRVEVPRREHQKIHGILPIDTELSRTMRQYGAVTRLSVSMKNWVKSYEKDFGTKPNIGLAYVMGLKKQLKGEIQAQIKEETKYFKHIKGLGPISLAGILAFAHPNRFPSLRKFLFYCGYTEASRKLKNYNRKIKPIMHETVKNLIIHKDTKYYQLYLKFKSDLGNHNKAMNRVSTYLLKEIYHAFHEQNKLVEQGSELIFNQRKSGTFTAVHPGLQIMEGSGTGGKSLT